VLVLPLTGHTPGHVGYRVRSGGQELLIWGDIIHWPAVQFARPDAAMTYDVDPGQAIATRKQILQEAAAKNLLVAGMHLPFPGLVRVRYDGAVFGMAVVG
jgi:glyoxylase-like metal-dependent hydrolase (beta-lactamase superfamily II)